MKSNFSLMLLFLLAIGFAVGCSDTVLVKPNKGFNISSQGDFSTRPPDTSNLYTKFLFIIDKSGSNVITPTDPNNIYRADNIAKFYAAHADNKYIKWGFIAFQESGATAYIQNPYFSADPQAMANALIQQRNNPDNGATPYKSALAMAQTVIRQDIADHPDETSHYMIFFMSDGMPTDYNPNQNEEPAGEPAFKDVDVLVGLLPGQINFSTAYYGPQNADAANGLQQMATRGKGKFVDLNQTGVINLDDLIAGGVTAEPYIIKDGSFLVFNVNTAICFDNTIGVDSDGDGLCDVDEIKLGKPYDPQNRFSFADGYSDYFHYVASTTPGGVLPACLDRSDEDHDLLTACEEAYMQNNTPSGTARTKADSKNPDTDGDGIIDGIEFFMLHNKSAPLDELNLFKSPDGETTNAGDQIRQHRNPLFQDANLPVEDVYDTSYVFKGYNSQGQSLYHFSQKYLKTFKTLPVKPENALSPEFAHGAGGNVILVYYIETLQREPKSPGIYVYSIQTLNGNGQGNVPGLDVSDKSFILYKVPTGP